MSSFPIIYIKRGRLKNSYTSMSIHHSPNYKAELAKLIILCGKQGISLWGQGDDSTADPSTNSDNILAILEPFLLTEILF